jgi:MYXO-CTERM domain-containing protein
MVDPFGKFTTSVTLKTGKNDIKVVASDGAGNSVPRTVSVTVTTAPESTDGGNWWWAAAGLVVALGIMLPLTALLINVAMKGGKPKEGSK